MDTTLYILVGITFLSGSYIFVQLFFDLLLRGFAPLIPSRPWVIDQIVNNIPIKEYRRVYSLGSGKSGFLHEFEKLFPASELYGIEAESFPYFVSRLQVLLRRLIFRPSRIRIIRAPYWRSDIKAADLIYCHLYPEDMKGLGKKIRFECRPGTVIVSTGFLVSDLDPEKTVVLEGKKGRFAWLSKDRELFRSKRKKYQKENKAFFYEI